MYIATITLRDPRFTYKLISPVAVQPGEVVGINKGIYCSSTLNYDNVLGVNMSGIVTDALSFQRVLGTTSSLFPVDPTAINPNSQIIPLIEPIFGKLYFNYQLLSPLT